MIERKRNKVVLRFVLFLLFVAGGAGILAGLDLHPYLTDRNRLADLISGFGPAGIPVFIGIQTLQVLVAPIPGEVTGFVGGYLYGGVAGVVYSTIGLTAGSFIAFLLSKRFGRPFVERVVKPDTLTKYDFLMEHRGVFISFLLFLIPGFPKDLLCYILGTSHMPFAVFAVISTAGRLLGTVLLSASGSLARSGEYRMMGVVLAIAAVGALFSYLFRNRWIAWLKAHRPHMPHHKPRDPGGPQG